MGGDSVVSRCDLFDRPQIVNLLLVSPSITEISVAGDPVGIVLGTSDRRPVVYSIVNGDGTLQLVGNTVRVLDPTGIDVDSGEMRVTIAATGYPDRAFVIRIAEPDPIYAIDFARRVPHPLLTFNGGTSISTPFLDYNGVTRTASISQERVVVGGRRVQQLMRSSIKSHTTTISDVSISDPDSDGYCTIARTHAEAANVYVFGDQINAVDSIVMFRFGVRRGVDGTSAVRYAARKTGATVTVTPD